MRLKPCSTDGNMQWENPIHHREERVRLFCPRHLLGLRDRVNQLHRGHLHRLSPLRRCTNASFIVYNHVIETNHGHHQANVEPRFEFGFGLSYTTFSYSNLKVSGSTAGGSRQSLGPGSSLDPW